MAIDLTPHKALAEAIAKAKKVILYEGLPHQKWEAALLARERKEKKFVSKHGFPYYEETLALKDADAKALTELVSQKSSFHAWGGMKWCGGFHPDYLIEWVVGKEVYQMAVCLGCHEVRVYGPKLEHYWDVDEEAYVKFKETLRAYRKNRPQK